MVLLGAHEIFDCIRWAVILVAEIVVFNEQGLNAMRHGKILPGALEEIFGLLKIPVMAEAEYRAALVQPPVVAVKGVRFTTIYGCYGTTDFVLRDSVRGIEIRFWCKWQETVGTVDEKLPYLLANLKRFPEKEVVFLVGGDGWRPGALDWLIDKTKRYARHVNGVKQKAYVLEADEVVELLLTRYGRVDEIEATKLKVKSLIKENQQMLDGQVQFDDLY